MLHNLCKPGRLGQWLVAFTACLCCFTSGQTYSWPSAALPKIRSGVTSYTVTSAEESWMVTFTFIGNVLSPIPAGMIMDKIGRKRTLHVFVLVAIISWLLLYTSYSVEALYVARLLAGLWAGFVFTLGPILIGEVVDPTVRGSVGSVFGTMLYLGGIYESLFGLYVSYDILNLASLIPSVIIFLLFTFLPETPYYHLMKGNRRLAAESMEWLQGCMKEDELDCMEKYVKEQLENQGSFLEIFRIKTNRKAFLMAFVLSIVQGAAGLTLLQSYSSVTIPDSFITGEQSTTVLNTVWFLSSIFSFFIIERFDRRTLMFVSSVSSTVVMLIVSLWYFLRDYTSVEISTTLWLPLFMFIIHGIFDSIALFPIPVLFRGEMFPVNIKGNAVALTNICMSIVSGATAKAYQPLTDNLGVFTNFVICAVACAVGAISAATFMTETRGKTLEEIQDDLYHKKAPKINTRF